MRKRELKVPEGPGLGPVEGVMECEKGDQSDIVR
jgi:hypothetical protein